MALDSDGTGLLGLGAASGSLREGREEAMGEGFEALDSVIPAGKGAVTWEGEAGTGSAILVVLCRLDRVIYSSCRRDI